MIPRGRPGPRPGQLTVNLSAGQAAVVSVVWKVPCSLSCGCAFRGPGSTGEAHEPVSGPGGGGHQPVSGVGVNTWSAAARVESSFHSETCRIKHFSWLMETPLRRQARGAVLSLTFLTSSCACAENVVADEPQRLRGLSEGQGAWESRPVRLMAASLPLAPHPAASSGPLLSIPLPDGWCRLQQGLAGPPLRSMGTRSHWAVSLPQVQAPTLP